MTLRKVLDSGARLTPPPWLPDNVLYETLMGSEAYGVSSEASDRDVYGICMPPKHVVFPHLAGEIVGFGTQPQRFESWQHHHVAAFDKSWDFQIFGIVKFFQIGADAATLVMRCSDAAQQQVLPGEITAPILANSRIAGDEVTCCTRASVATWRTRTVHNFAFLQGRMGSFKLTPGLIALLADQLERLVLEPYQQQIVRHLLQGKSVAEVAAITGEPLERVLWSAIYAVSQTRGRRPPPASPTVRPRNRPPRPPLNAAAELEFTPEELLSAVASVTRSEEHLAAEDAVFEYSRYLKPLRRRQRTRSRAKVQ